MNKHACDRVQRRLLFTDQRSRDFQKCVLFYDSYFLFLYYFTAGLLCGAFKRIQGYQKCISINNKKEAESTRVLSFESVQEPGREKQLESLARQEEQM